MSLRHYDSIPREQDYGALNGEMVFGFNKLDGQNFCVLYKPKKRIVANNRGKKQLFNGVDEITFYFEWVGENSFAGKHQEGDEMHLALIDVFMKKRGYIEPKDFVDLFYESGIDLPALVYKGPLTAEIIEKIRNNDWTEEGCEFPYVKEGVVFKRSTLLPGQRRPSVKVKTKWWLNKLHSMYSEEECKIFE